jgi:hypothetical protein
MMDVQMVFKDWGLADDPELKPIITHIAHKNRYDNYEHLLKLHKVLASMYQSHEMLPVLRERCKLLHGRCMLEYLATQPHGAKELYRYLKENGA